jgi:hypothetical protein
METLAMITRVALARQESVGGAAPFMITGQFTHQLHTRGIAGNGGAPAVPSSPDSGGCPICPATASVQPKISVLLVILLGNGL